MIRHLGNSLTEMLYILDEPSVGLHARDVARLTGLLKKLRDKGNTVLIVEHDPDVMAIAEHLVDVGPRAGPHGGEVVLEGTFAALRDADTLTGRSLRQHLPIKQWVRPPTGKLTIRNATEHNLKDVTARLQRAGRGVHGPGHKQGSVYVMDEPTTGLHLSDIGMRIIDLGPEGGSAGGQVLFEGPPKELAACERSLTGRYL